jgi:hypothetical protein
MNAASNTSRARNLSTEADAGRVQNAKWKLLLCASLPEQIHHLNMFRLGCPL